MGIKISNTVVRRVFMVGIKGVAMAALAVYLRESGVTVAGSDTDEEFPTDNELQDKHIEVHTGFDPDVISQKIDLVIYTGAHGGRDNPLVKQAVQLGIPTLAHGRALGEVMSGKQQIVVAGSHGKTTTAAMIATILDSCGKDPSWAIGCGSISGKPAGHFGRGNFFVAEGDEYVTDPGHDTTPRFLWLAPHVLVLTNIDFDHPDVYKDLAHVTEVFDTLQQKSETAIINADDSKSRGFTGTTFGFSPRADTRITHIGVGAQRTFFTIEHKGMSLGEFSLKVPGRHNVANAAAAIACCTTLGMSAEEIKKGLLAFTGTKRRFEKLGVVNGVVYYDDYAHHPAEIAATLAGARSWYPDKKIVAVFQPHTYSRTKALLHEFASSFTQADRVVLTEIYASAREHDTLGITGKTLFIETLKVHKDVVFAENPKSVPGFLSGAEVVIFMGAGDIYHWGRDIWKNS